MCSSAGGRAGGFFDCDKDSLMPSQKEPRTVNAVRPADLQLVAALGGSLMSLQIQVLQLEPYPNTRLVRK
ncbi:unnamed protein product [Nippostrongylus brasiliensis]|uniref:Uncharacterized protein n=1 Tax=Nippostrongylus brasiliensis TaxID=27835 RepID=A0A0N4YDR6_NIPBR|nr:unnamed protein product [Nippostrongylus brasiliensis]